MSDVSRETDSLQEHFSDVPGLRQYADILADRGVELGLLGPREVPRIWPRHLANCAVVASEERVVIPPGAHVADVGSGAGLPGVVWALVRPDLRLTLVEPLLRRATFLTEVVAELGLSPRVDVARSRAEDLVGTYDVGHGPCRRAHAPAAPVDVPPRAARWVARGPEGRQRGG